MAPSYSGVWNISTQYQYRTGWPFDANLSAVGIVAGGVTAASAVVNTIEKFLTAASSGNATDFGDLSVARHASSSMGNDTRAIFAGGWDNYGGSSRSNVIDYITYSTSGNATDFGDVAATTSDANCSASNNVRGITFGGRLYSNGNIDNAIEYLTIASTGNATDFGDLSVGGSYTQRHRQGNGMSGSTTRGLASGGYTPAALSNTIQYVTIASAGNSTDFGDMSSSTDELAHMSSNTRGVIAGGSGGGGTFINTIEYVTIASTGNVTDFGDMTVAKAFLMGASSSTKGFIIGGSTASGIATVVNSIETIAFSTTGNATDFGDITTATRSGSANTSGHAAVQDTAFATLPATRGLLGSGGYTSTFIEYIDIASTGNGRGFGDLLYAGTTTGTASSSTRNVVGGRRISTGRQDHIDFNTYSTKGKAVDFGNLTQNGDGGGGGVSNGTRGVISIGHTGSAFSNALEYVTIASEGNATDFGDLVDDANTNATGVSNTTIGLFTGSGYNTGDNGAKIDAITIASTGNATDFGDRSIAAYSVGAVSNSTRGVFAGGSLVNGTAQNVMDYVTFSSAGNATDFGDLSTARRSLGGGMSNSTRGVFAQWSDSVSNNVMDYITIASVGNATDFGDQIGLHTNGYGDSNGHGGIA